MRYDKKTTHKAIIMKNEVYTLDKILKSVNDDT